MKRWNYRIISRGGKKRHKRHIKMEEEMMKRDLKNKLEIRN